jgi:hypothetical protein
MENILNIEAFNFTFNRKAVLFLFIKNSTVIPATKMQISSNVDCKVLKFVMTKNMHKPIQKFTNPIKLAAFL